MIRPILSMRARVKKELKAVSKREYLYLFKSWNYHVRRHKAKYTGSLGWYAGAFNLGTRYGFRNSKGEVPAKLYAIAATTFRSDSFRES